MRYPGITQGAFVADEKLELARRMRRSPTPAEAQAWAILRNRGCAGLKFRRQQVIRGLIVDFYCAQAQLAIELDGEAHHDTADYDAARDHVLELEGVRVLGIANADVDRLAGLINAEFRGKACDAPSPVMERGSGGEVAANHEDRDGPPVIGATTGEARAVASTPPRRPGSGA